MRACVLLLLGLPVLMAQQTTGFDYRNAYDYGHEYASQHQGGQTEVELQTEPTEPGPLESIQVMCEVCLYKLERLIVQNYLLINCREEKYPCTRLYSVHQPCKQCVSSICVYSLRRVYVINKEICERTVCAHEELIKADLCRDQFPRCGVAALIGQCGTLGSNCGKSCGSC